VTHENLNRYLRSRRREIEAALDRWLSPGTGRPVSLVRAMRYAVLGGGKRLRPVLTLAAAEAVGGARARMRALPAGCAIEMIHAYSLAHDDLPAMDDDEVRRGKPSLHAKFGEATAILTGDALLTDAFAVAARTGRGIEPARTVRILSEIARAAGSAGMVAGQVRDLESEGRARPGRRVVETIHRQKTGALLRASVRVGAISVGAEAAELRRLSAYGDAFGLAFQIADDILDEVGDAALLGRPGGGDRAASKATYPAVWGIDRARAEVRRLAAVGRRSIQSFGRRGVVLGSLFEHVVDRAS